jgi:hypothetical protein
VRTSPSIAPNGLERDIYLVLDDFGHLGRAWLGVSPDQKGYPFLENSNPLATTSKSLA